MKNRKSRSERETLSRNHWRTGGVAVAASLALVLSACAAGGGGSTSESQESSSQPTTQEALAPEGKLVIWEHANEANQAYFEAKYAEYESLTGVEIEVLYIPIGDLQTKLQTAFGSGSPPDIIKIGAWQMMALVERGNLSPVDPINFGAESASDFAAKFEDGALDAVTFNNEVYAVPTDFNSVSLWYRKDIFEAAGLDPESPPQTWEEVASFSDTIESSGASPVGLQSTLASDPIWAQLVFQPLIEGLGGSILNDEGTEGSLNTPEGIKALEYYAGIGDPRFDAPIGGFSMFADGNAAMLLGGRFMDGFMQSLNPELVYGESFASTEIPSWSGLDRVASGYSWGWAVAQESSNKHTAWNLIGWLNERERLEEQLAATGLVTPIKDWTSMESAQDEASQVMQAQLPYTSYGVPSANWNEIMTALSEILDGVALGVSTPQEAAADFDSRVQSIVQ